LDHRRRRISIEEQSMPLTMSPVMHVTRKMRADLTHIADAYGCMDEQVVADILKGIRSMLMVGMYGHLLYVWTDRRTDEVLNAHLYKFAVSEFLPDYEIGDVVYRRDLDSSVARFDVRWIHGTEEYSVPTWMPVEPLDFSKGAWKYDRSYFMHPLGATRGTYRKDAT
jgi:hypothetical protein